MAATQEKEKQGMLAVDAHKNAETFFLLVLQKHTTRLLDDNMTQVCHLIAM